jgi:tetratricopeptide (TPR) repeat protein
VKLSYEIEHCLAILIGTGNYEKNDFIPISPVKGNLEDLRNIFLDKDIFGFSEQRVIVLEDKTNYEIIKALKDVLSDTTLKTVFIYYSGHGHRTTKDRLYLTAYNSEKDFDLIEYSGIEFTKLKSIIENSPGKPTSIVIIDACYSGIAAQSESNLTDEEKTINGAYIITSSSSKEQSFFDPDGKHTFFTDELIEILNNGSEKSDELFSINDIYDNLQKRLRSKKLSEPQRRDNLDSKSFYFAKNKKYNKEFFIRKAEEHFKNGNYSRAMEYYFTLLEKFNDTDYSKQIERCQKEIEYLTVLLEADSLYSIKKYEQALDKYIEAKKMKSDRSLLFKISQCENYVLMRKEFLEEQQKELEESKRKELEDLNRIQEEEQIRKEKDQIQNKIEEERKQKEFELKEIEVNKERQQKNVLRIKQEEELKQKKEDEFKIKQEKELKQKKKMNLK